MQHFVANKPVKLVTDKSEFNVLPDEATFLRGYRINFNKNQNKSGEEGGNAGVGTGVNSTVEACPTLLLPPGINKTIGAGSCTETNHFYLMNWNSNNLHGIYRISGDTLLSEIIMVDARLMFSIDPKNFIAQHRMTFRVVYNSGDGKKREIKEIIMNYTDGNQWQRWINILSAIATKGYNATDFPYYTLHKPHYDFEEFIDWPMRQPMFCPAVTAVPSSDSDVGKPNNLIDKSIQFAIVAYYTDGRTSFLSPFSAPYIFEKTNCISGSTGATRCLDLKIYAGGAHVEAIRLLQRNCGGDWRVYDTIKRFTTSGVNDPVVIGNKYWLRTNPWAGLSYSAEENTFTYRYCGDKECTDYSVTDAIISENNMPLLSNAMTPAGDAILLSNNLYGYPNISNEIINSFKLDVVHNQDNASCPVKLVTIKLYAYMSRQDKYNQLVWKRGSESKDIRFGSAGNGKRVTTKKYSFFEYESDYFNLKLGEKEGFICYLAGTNYSAIGKQVLFNHGDISDVGVIDLNSVEQTDAVANIIDNSIGYYLQEFTFVVPAGNYIARIASHTAEPTGDYQKTSTYVAGRVDGRAMNSRGADSGSINRSKEVPINVCDGVDQSYLKDCFYIFIPWKNDLDKSQDIGRFIDGYLYEDSTDKIAVEYFAHEQTHGGAPYVHNGGYTDHNGFFYISAAGGAANRAEVNFSGRYNCEYRQYLFQTTIGGNAQGFYPNQIKTIKGAVGAYGPCNRILIKGSVKDCITGIAMVGIGVTLEGTQTYYTNGDGNFEVIAHRIPNGSRINRIYFNSGENCQISSCDCTCVPTEDYTDANIACNNCEEVIYPITFYKRVKTNGGLRSSLKDGGRYGVPIRIFDISGRATFSTVIAYKDIPTVMEYGSISPAKISWILMGNPVFPSWAKYLTFGITNNLNNKRYLQWVGDKIEFLDVNGETTSTGNGAILAKLTIQSLLDFNVANNFSTNATYQFVAGDKIRFYDDGKGNYFKPDPIKGYMDFIIRGTDFDTVADTTTDEAPDGKTLIIDFDERLLPLKDGCGFWIEIISPRDCADLESYGEICGTIPIVAGKLMQVGGELNAFDTYYISRKISITGCTGKAQSHPFASQSPSDYWGKNCSSFGRISFKDDQAEQKWYEDDVIKSDDYVNEGRVNGLGTFRVENRRNYKGNEWGGVVAIHAERGLVFFLCQNDWFVANYQQNFIRSTAQGLVVADINTNLGDPDQKVGNNFGCDYEDTATVQFFNGQCVWLDAKNSGIIVMNYQSVADISLQGVKSYFINKLKYISQYNKALAPADYLANLFEKVAGIDPEHNKYFITFRPRKNLSTSPIDFINNERDFFVDMQETLEFDLTAKEWTGSSSWAPEFYAQLKESITGTEMISFYGGRPHFHNSKNVRTVNQVYGVKTDMVIQIVQGKVEPDESKDKLYQSIAVDKNGPQMYVDSLVTNTPTLYSYVPIPFMIKKANIYFASLLRNMNVYQEKSNPVESTLHDGSPLTGMWTKITLVIDPKNMDKYGELNYIWLRYSPQEKTRK